jgi:hypothetical protein
MYVDTLHEEPGRVAALSAKQLKCGTCRKFIVKPSEVEVARIARPMAACGPGSYCFGGPVRGWCEEHKQQQESTGLCMKHEDGGPGIRGIDGSVPGSLAVGSANGAGGKALQVVKDLLPLEVAGLALAFAAWFDSRRD